MRVTPPLPLRTAYRPILALRTAYRHFSVSRTAYRVTIKTTMFGVYIYKRDNGSMLHLHVQLVFQTLYLMCLRVRFPSFDLPKLMFKFIIA